MIVFADRQDIGNQQEKEKMRDDFKDFGLSN